MNKGNRVLVLMGILVILSFFIGPVSAESLNITEVELAAQGVKNYTEVNGNVPGFVVVSEKNSTTPSFLNTLTKTTVQLNSGSTTPVTIATVNNPTGPSGSASGTLQKSSYVTMASNIQSFISSNGRAPNYASSSLGNVRYESLVYLYSKIINYYYLNGQLPS